MKFFQRILTAIALLSIAGCFGFSVAAALPDGVWDGSYELRNNRNYVINGHVRVSKDFTVPPDTVITLTDGSELVISDNAALSVKGGINVRKGSSLTVTGGLNIEEGGSLSVSGNAYAEDNSEFSVYGGVEIKPEGFFRIKSHADFENKSLVVSEGRLEFKRGSVLNSDGRIVIAHGGELVTNGETNISENGILESVGSFTVERKGRVNVFGEVSLFEGSSFSMSGRINAMENGVINDLSTHIDLSVYTAEILKNEEEVILRGIDVSWVQGDIDWEAVSKSGIDFVIIRAGRGDIDGEGPKEDTHFFRNIQGANRYGIDVGVYFYSYAETPEDAEEEAELVLELLRGHTVTYPVIYDMEEEVGKPDLSHIAEAFLETVAAGGYYPMIYSYRFGLDANFSRDFKEKYAIWVAQLKNRPETNYDYYIWQYSHEGRVNGIEGNVDFNVAYRDFPDILRDYGLNRLVRSED